MIAYKISRFIDSAEEGRMYPVEIASAKIIILKKQGCYFAFQALCPHAGTPLVNGYIDAKNCVVCATHFYKFDVRTGNNVSGEGYKLKIYPTGEVNGEWYVWL